MLPLLMHLRIRRPGRRGFRLYFPVILVWIIVIALLLVLLPFILLAALITRRFNGPGFALLLVYPMLFAVLWHLGGLHIETKSDENEVLIDFA
jgi:hypothetical protein